MEQSCVENQTGNSGEELPERTFCRVEALHRAESHQGRRLKEIRDAAKEKLQIPSWLRSRKSVNRRTRGAGWRRWESAKEEEKAAQGNRAAAGRLLQPSVTLWSSSLFGWIRAQNERQKQKKKRKKRKNYHKEKLLDLGSAWSLSRCSALYELPSKWNEMVTRVECL